MSSNNAVFGLIMIVIGLVIICIMVLAILWIAGIAIAAGTAFGGSVSLYNYGVAFKNNVKLENPAI
jgi:hypothetical protein